MAAGHPPQPRLTLNVGITGHRASILPPDLVDDLVPVADEVFRQLAAAMLRLHQRERALFDPAPPQLRLHTPLASGADQLAARSARASAFDVRALLPFDPDDYRADFTDPDERADFERELKAADQLFALPGQRSDEDGAYVLVGKAVVAAADILIAIWDGSAANGPGGTAHVVDQALSNTVPVIHILVDRSGERSGELRLLTDGEGGTSSITEFGTPDSYDALLGDTLLPHTPDERQHIADYFTETTRRYNWRLEYPLLLTCLFVRSLPRAIWRETPLRVLDRNKRSDLHAYEWANLLAIRYAQMFRSGHVANYILSASAVLLALVGLLVPAAKVFLVIAELGTIGLLFLNTRAGTDGEWHRRWLQYRHLAESLRPLFFLKSTGLISTPFRSDFVRGKAHRETGADWTRWYAAAIWREMKSPIGSIGAAETASLARDFRELQIIPQADYHRINAARMTKLDHRLHEVGNFLIGAVICVCCLYLVGYVFAPYLAKSLTDAFIFLTAGLPAVGAAVFGLRGHGEHLLAASRSMNSAMALDASATRLAEVTDAGSLARELEHAASIMLADLNEWTIAYRERSLEIPA